MVAQKKERAVNIRITSELYDELKILAKEENRSMSGQVVKFVQDKLKEMKEMKEMKEKRSPTNAT